MRIGERARHLARFGAQGRDGAVDPGSTASVAAADAQADGGVGRGDPHVGVRVFERAEDQRRRACRAERRDLPRAASARRRIGRGEPVLDSLGHVGPDERVRARSPASVDAAASRAIAEHARRDPTNAARTEHARRRAQASPLRRRAIQCAPSARPRGAPTPTVERAGPRGARRSRPSASGTESRPRRSRTRTSRPSPTRARGGAPGRAVESAHSSPPASHAKSRLVLEPVPTRRRAV